MKRKGLILFGLLACLTFAACGSKNTNTSQEKEVEDTQETKEQEEEKKEEQEENTEDGENQEASSETENQEENQEEETIYNMGETANLGDWSITVTDMQIVESIAADYGQYSPDEEGNRYIQVFVTATNNGKESDRFLPYIGMGDDVNAKVIFGDGYEFPSTNLLGYSNEMHDANISPLSSQSGEIAFDIPETVYNSEEELQIHFILKNDVVKFKIR